MLVNTHETAFGPNWDDQDFNLLYIDSIVWTSPWGHFFFLKDSRIKWFCVCVCVFIWEELGLLAVAVHSHDPYYAEYA